MAEQSFHTNQKTSYQKKKKNQHLTILMHSCTNQCTTWETNLCQAGETDG